jgi:mannitol/fructose-specific phosphotransferase system IIA component (Ntr-type)
MKLTQFLAPERVWIKVPADDRNGLLAFLAREIASSRLVPDENDFLDLLLRREEEMSTGVGRGLAVPHADPPQMPSTFLAAATLAKPIDYQSFDRVPVDVVFMIFGRPDNTTLHLRLLARISRVARLSGFLDHLRRVETSQAFLQVVEEAEKSLATD